jgi:hypothetical protein
VWKGGKENIFYTRHIKKAFCKASVSQRRRILRIFSGNVHTNQGANKWGMQEHNTCPFDQEIDTQIHRIWNCKGTPHNRTEEPWERFALNTSRWPLNERAVCSIDRPKRIELRETYTYYYGDKEVEPFAFDPEDGDIYTDGSAYDMDLPTAIAGAAACQKSRSKWKSIRWPVPVYLPQSATIAEMIGLIMAISAMKPGRHYRVVCDCKAVVDGAARWQQPPNPKSLWGWAVETNVLQH